MNAYTYTFRKSVGRPAETWRLDGTWLRNDTGVCVDLATVTGGSLSDASSGQVWACTLVLKHEHGATRIACQDDLATSSRAEFMSMVTMVLGDLATTRPEAEFYTGRAQSLTWAITLIGGIMFGVGLYYLAVAFLTFGGEQSEFALSMGGLAVLFGWFLAWSGSPWSKPKAHRPREMLDWLPSWVAQTSAS